jgi:mannose-6-phosphate isomerase-like protein (cupin superfamily)
MDVLIDWESVPWDENESQPGYSGKTFAQDGLEFWRGELTEEYADEGWMTEHHVFVFHVVEGEASVRFRDGRLIPVRQGDTGIIPPGEVGAHTVDVPAGGHVVIVGVSAELNPSA